MIPKAVLRTLFACLKATSASAPAATARNIVAVVIVNQMTPAMIPKKARKLVTTMVTFVVLNPFERLTSNEYE